jgi:hypothetical protein
MKRKVMTAFLLSLAIITSYIVPSVGSIPDFNVILMVIIIILNNTYKDALICGIFLGILSALTIKTPNGQIPIFICKIIISQIVYLLILLIGRTKEKSINIILFVGLFLDTLIYFILWFYMNGITLINNKYGRFAYMELILVIILLSVINTIIGKNIIKIVNKCIEYDKRYNDI